MRCWVKLTLAGAVPRGARVLIPAGPDDEAGFDALRPEIELRADVVEPRNPGLHRKAFVLLNKVFPHTNYPSVERLRAAMTIGAGFVHDIVDPYTGEVHWIPKSWEFAAMDDIEFRELYNRLVDVALALVAGSKREDWQDAEMDIARM